MDTLPTLAEIAAPDDPLTFAEQTIKRVADELTARLRTKYPKAMVEFRIGTGDDLPHAAVLSLVESSKSAWQELYEATYGIRSVREIADKLRAAIDALPDPMADAWQFDESDPRNAREGAAP